MAGENEVAKAYVTIIPSMRGSQREIASAMTGAMSAAGTASGAVAGAAASKAAASGLGAKLLGFISPVASAAGLGAGVSFASQFAKFALPVGIAVAFAALGKQCADSFEAVEEGTNNLLQATGATGEAAEQLIGVYKNVAQSVSGDFDEIGAAVGELNTRLGLTGADLESASTAMMEYAKITGQDAVAATQDVASMMRNVGIPTEELGDTLGKLTVAGQQAGIDVSSLATNITKYNAVMKQMGLTTDEQIALMAEFEVSGADTASILNAMKRGVASWATEGKDARVEFDNFVKGVQDGTVTAGDAVEIFGRRGGLSMYEAAQKGQLSFEDMYDAISGASQENLDQIYYDTLTVGEKLGIIKNNFMEVGAAIAEPFVDGISAALTGVLPLVQQFADGTMAFMEELGTALAPAGEALASLFSGIMESGAAQTLLSSIGGALSTIANIIGSVLTPVIQILSPIIGLLFEVWSNGMSIVLNLVSGLASQIVATLLPYVQQFADFISPYLEQLKSWFEQNLPAIQSTCETVISAIMSFVSAALPVVVGLVTGAVGAIKRVIGTIQTIVSTVQNIFNRVKMAIYQPIMEAKAKIVSIVNTIKGIFSNLKLELPHPKLPHLNVYGGEAPWGIGGLGKKPEFSIDWYAQGGIFTAPSIIGVGEAGAEAVLPLSRLDDMFEADGGDTFNLYINGTQMMSDEAIETRFYSLMDNLLMKYKLMRGH